ncbi:hypothetical protein OG21DRAFT_370401 [Imleria badia]|nr:hypothetical protein OG21DRAFT_370401 [Imleria badia]
MVSPGLGHLHTFSVIKTIPSVSADQHFQILCIDAHSDGSVLNKNEPETFGVVESESLPFPVNSDRPASTMIVSLLGLAAMLLAIAGSWKLRRSRSPAHTQGRRDSHLARHPFLSLET